MGLTKARYFSMAKNAVFPISATAKKRHCHYPSGTGSGSQYVYRRKHLSRQRKSETADHRLEQDQVGNDRASQCGGNSRRSRDSGERHRHWQTAACRNCQSFDQESQASHSRRADSRSQRERLDASSRPSRRSQTARHHLHPCFPQTQRNLLRRRPHHRDSRRLNHRNAGQQQPRGGGGAHHSGNGRARAERAFPKKAFRRRREAF